MEGVMIELWSGTPGSGKSASVVVYALDFIQRGGCVLANFDLAPDWAEHVARHYVRSWFSESYYKRQVEILKNRWWTFGTVDDVWDFSKKFDEYISKSFRKRYEGRCLIIIDECQLIFNSRVWQKNFGWVEFFSQHRKLGYDILLISHNVEMVDSQCRNYIEYVVKLRNLRRVHIPFVQIPMSWLFLCRNLFFAKWFYYGVGVLSGDCWKNRFLRLHLWQARLYDSVRIFRVGDDEQASGLRRSYREPEPDPAPLPPPHIAPIADALAAICRDLRCRRRVSSAAPPVAFSAPRRGALRRGAAPDGAAGGAVGDRVA